MKLFRENTLLSKETQRSIYFAWIWVKKHWKYSIFPRMTSILFLDMPEIFHHEAEEGIFKHSKPKLKMEFKVYTIFCGKKNFKWTKMEFVYSRI